MEQYRVDTMTLDGEGLNLEDGTATIDGAAGFERDPVLAAYGDDSTTRKRVARTIKTKLFTETGFDPQNFSKVRNAQIVMTNLQTGQRVRAGKCAFQSLGTIGEGTVEVTFVVLSNLQFL